MKLTALRLHNVRRFTGRGVAVEGIGSGVNVLCAANEYGKSTCFDALHALFFQAHTGTPGAVQALRPYSGGSPFIEADIETGKGRFRLSKQYYAGRHARVSDIATGRILAQADEAERFISKLVRGGAAGPAGLLWVRQGNTGIDKRSPADEKSEREAREGVLSSVQGEVEALTGGRRMVDAIAACSDELLRLVTATGKPKVGGPYDAAMKERDRLAEEEHRLTADVQALHEALNERRRARTRLADLDDADEAAIRRRKAEEAQAAFEAARKHRDALASAETRAELLRSRRDAAVKELAAFRAAQQRGRTLEAERDKAAQIRDAAQARRQALRDQADAAAKAVEAAEKDERQARDLLARLDRAMRAREAADRKAALAGQLDQAEAARKEIEAGTASLATLTVPQKLLKELDTVETELAGLRAAMAARVPSVTMRYAAGADGSVVIDGAAMEEGKAYLLHGTTRLMVGTLGTLTLAPGSRDSVEDDLAEAEGRRHEVLAAIGVDTLAAARQRNDEARRRKTEIDLARQRLAILAPYGLEALRTAVARAEAESAGLSAESDSEGDPATARQACEAAEKHVMQSRNAAREYQPAIEQAGLAFIEAEKTLSSVSADLEQVNALLGPEPDRHGRESLLARDAAEAETALEPVAAEVETLRGAAPDMESVEAAMRRAQSVVDAATAETAALRERIADLNGRISARSQDAVEEALQETSEAHSAAAAAVTRFEREVAVLTRLRAALETARTEARDHYFEPVLGELRPLLGLLFDDAHVVFDDATLLPSTVKRDGQVEDVDRLSGGMREQLAVLTRLAFARLLAREGRPTPVILDDALVYSDDDRIERMFDALHRQGRDQQVLVFSCRQRAFANLGGTMLRMTDWTPQGT